MKKENNFDKKAKKIVRDMIILIGDNPNREGLKDTPERVAKMWKEIFRGYNINEMPKITTFNNGKDEIIYDEMVGDIGTFFSHCEHHMVPFFGKYYFAYIPHPNGKLIGLSKVARVIDYFAAKLQIQERLTHEVVEFLWNKLAIPRNRAPLAMGLVIEAEHLCKTMRGVKKKGNMRTTKLIGTFKTDTAARAEFLDWVNNNGNN